MQRRLWIDIPECEHIIVFVHDIGRDFPRNDFEKKVI
jgi:hypothetical protein